MTGPDPFNFGPPSQPRPPAGFPDPTIVPGPPASDYRATPDDFGHDTLVAYTDPYAIGGPPHGWLVGAIALGASGAAAALVIGTAPLVALAAWVAAGPLAIGLLAVFSVRDTAERTRMAYVAREWVRVLYWGTVLIAAIGIGLSAWRLAEWAGRQ